MTALDDLYQAILADPDADDPRIVYADALQSAGDPRGEFIALQCELARLGCDRTRVAQWGLAERGAPNEHARRDWIGDALVDDDRSRIAPLRVRERELLTAHGNAWACGLAATHRFRRGFIDHVVLSEHTNREEVFAAAPLVRSFEFGQRGAAPYADPRLARLDQLRVDLRSEEEREAFLAHAPTWRLSELALSDRVDRPEGFYRLPEALISRLRALDLWGCRISRPSAFARVLELAPLDELRLGDNGYGPSLLLALASSDSTLSVLDFCMFEGRYEALADAAFSKLQALRLLDSSTDWLVPHRVRAVISLSSLRVLDLGGNVFLKRQFRRIVEEEKLAALVQLGLRGCDLDDGSIDMLCSSSLFDRVRVLDLSSNPITDVAAQRLERGFGGDRLEVLDLRATRIRPSEIERLRARFPEAEVKA